MHLFQRMVKFLYTVKIKAELQWKMLIYSKNYLHKAFDSIQPLFQAFTACWFLIAAAYSKPLSLSRLKVHKFWETGRGVVSHKVVSTGSKITARSVATLMTLYTMYKLAAFLSKLQPCRIFTNQVRLKHHTNIPISKPATVKL